MTKMEKKRKARQKIGKNLWDEKLKRHDWVVMKNYITKVLRILFGQSLKISVIVT